jgi:hypothetical protein
MKKIILILLLLSVNICYGEVLNLICTVHYGNGDSENHFYINSDKKIVKRDDKLLNVKDLKVDDGSIQIESVEDLTDIGLGKRLNVEKISRISGLYQKYILSEKYPQSTVNGKCESRKPNKF